MGHAGRRHGPGVSSVDLADFTSSSSGSSFGQIHSRCNNITRHQFLVLYTTSSSVESNTVTILY